MRNTPGNISATREVVRAYEALREAVLSSCDGITTPFHGQRLLREGLLSWGVYDASTRYGASAFDGTRGGAPDGNGTLSGQPEAAVVRLMATMTLQSISPVEARA